MFFDPATEDWEIRLSKILVHASGVRSNTLPDERFNYDLAIITAHAHTELEQVLALPANWQKKKFENDSGLYHIGQFTRDQTTLTTVASCTVQMGMPAAAILTMKLVEHFRPRFIAMSGIAAGVEGRYGDILIADQSWDYGSGKSIRWDDMVKFEPAPDPIPIPPFLRRRLAQFRIEREVLRRDQHQIPVPGAMKVRFRGTPLCCWSGEVA